MPRSRIQFIIDYIFSYPGVSNFLRSIVELGFVETKKAVRKELDGNKKTLDIGCGGGTFSVLFKDYTGIDIDPKFIEYARKKREGEFYVMDARDIKFKDNFFDNILVISLLHHLDDKAFLKVISEAKRVLRENGQILVIAYIPTQSRFNIIGKVAQKLDLGENIRKVDHSLELLGKNLFLKKSYKIRSGISDYAVLVLTKK